MDANERETTEISDEPARKRIRPDPSPDYNPEDDVGITEFVSSHEGFDGIIKYRYSDFLVNEISTDGKIVRLTDLSCPDYSQTKSNSTSNIELDDDIIEKLKTLSETRNKDIVSIPVENFTKDQRTSVHHFVRSIDMNLKSELTQNVIQVTYQPLSNQTRRATEQWPDKSKPYLKFILYKENRDTMESIQSIAGCLNMNTSLFQYAGIKDKRGKTCQEVTIHKVLPSKFKQINQRLPSIKVGNFQLSENPLRLGQLQGNRFEIFIRNIPKTNLEQQIETYVKNWIDNGYINYFGLQRFGSRTLATQTVGKYLLRHDWSLAIDAILSYDESITHDWLRNLLKQWNQTRDLTTVLDGSIPYRRSIEVDLLRGLQKHGQTNLIGALSCIPRNTRLLYLHAYQSMIWNKIVSRRLKTYGKQILIGDLYLKNLQGGGGEDHNSNNEVFIVDETNREHIQLEQIVLPLPGYDIKYPSNDIHSWYKDLLNEDGIDINQMKYQVKDYSLPGNYRQFLLRPEQVEYRIVYYDNITDDPLQSDYERLIQQSTNVKCELKQYMGLILAFSLPKSSYATMALREILHRNESKLQTHHQQQEQESNINQDNDLEDVIS